MRYDSIQPAAFVAVQPLTLPMHTLAFPAPWRQPILDLYTATWKEQSKARAKTVPIRRLNALLRVVAPDLVSTAKRASLDDATPWLYATSPFPEPVLRTLINAWLYDLPRNDEAKALVLPTINKLDPTALRWRPEQVDLLAHGVSAGNTAIPEPRLYTLLPDVVAAMVARYAEHTPYEHEGRSLRYRRVAANPSADYAELISWPPLAYDATSRKAVTRWYYSSTIQIALRTSPFDPTPRLHINTGIRRWTAGELHTKSRTGASVYLLTDNPLVDDAPEPEKFAVAHIHWDPRTTDMAWRHGGVGEMLNRVSAIKRLPEADLLGRKSDAWLFDRDDVTAAVTYHTTMRGRTHPVGAGIMPVERSRVMNWVAEALKPHFALMPPLTRIEAGSPIPTLQPLASVPKVKKTMTDAQREEVEARQVLVREANADTAAANARRRRHRLHTAITGDTLSVALLYQEPSTGMRRRLLDTVERLLDLSPRDNDNASAWTWRVGGLTVNIYARPLGALGKPLGNGTRPKKGRQHDDAVTERRSSVATALRALTDTIGDTPQLVLVELEGAEAFTARTTDPKFAIRMGCADANMVSQFIRPDEADDEANDHRAEAAWHDAFRQLGMRFIPQHTIASGIPDDLNQLAFWIVKRRNDDTNTHPLFVPIAVLIRPGQDHIMGKAEGMTTWVPYPELLKYLAGHRYSTSPTTEDEQQARVAAFIRATLNQFRSTQTLVATEAHNIRFRLPMLQNANLAQDAVQFGQSTVQRLSLFGKHLRMVRICGSQRLETPQAWAFDGAKIGISEGLWAYDKDGENAARVYYSTVAKPLTHSKVGVELAKLTPHHTIVKDKAKSTADEVKTKEVDHYDPTATAWNPELLEFVITGLPDRENSTTWAAFLHQQRFCSDDYRAALGLPLIMHLAQLANEYAIPANDDGDTESGAEIETDDDVQLEFDFDSL